MRNSETRYCPACEEWLSSEQFEGNNIVCRECYDGFAELDAESEMELAREEREPDEERVD